MPNPIYPEIYSLLQTYIYGADAMLTGDQTLTLTIMATTACVFAVSIPFLIVFGVIKMLR